MFPIPFPGPTATEGLLALLQAAAVGLACSPTTGTLSVAHVHPAAEVSREFSLVPALHSSGLVLRGVQVAASTAHLGRAWVKLCQV